MQARVACRGIVSKRCDVEGICKPQGLGKRPAEDCCPSGVVPVVDSAHKGAVPGTRASCPAAAARGPAAPGGRARRADSPRASDVV